jgi:type IV secretory pathway TrbL component
MVFRHTGSARYPEESKGMQRNQQTVHHEQQFFGKTLQEGQNVG